MFTLQDARREKLMQDAEREHRAAVKEARAKVRKWERKVAQYGGDVHRATLAKFRAQLAALIG